MRVEVTFGGDPVEALASADAVIDVLKKLFVTADETGHQLSEVKISTAQATESDANARRIKDQLDAIRLKADETQRSLSNVRVGGRGGGLASGLQGAQTIGLASLLGLGVTASGPLGAAGGAALLTGLTTTLATALPAVGELVLAFHGMSGAIEGNEKDFEKLNPQAQQFVQTIRGLIPWVHQLQSDAQAGLLPGAEDLLHGLFSPQNAQMIEGAVTSIGQALGAGAKEWGAAFGSAGFTSGAGEVLQHVSTWLREDADAALQLAEGLGKIVVAGLPLDDWLVKAIDHGATLFNQWVDGAEKSGRLAGGLQSAEHELSLVAHLVEALGIAAFDLSRDLEPLGNEIIVGLTHALQDFGTWLDKNRVEINNVAQGALQALIGALHLLMGIIVPVGRAIYDATQDTIGFKNAFEILLGLFAGAKLASTLTAVVTYLAGPLGVAGAASTAVAEVGTLRLALLSLGSPAVLAALAAAAIGGYKVGQLLAGNPNGPFPLVKPTATVSGSQVDLSFPQGDPRATQSVLYDTGTGTFTSSVLANGKNTVTGISLRQAAAAIGVSVPDLLQAIGGPTNSTSNVAAALGALAGTVTNSGSSVSPWDMSSVKAMLGQGATAPNPFGGLSPFGKPPAFTSGLGPSTSFGLPPALQLSIDKALTTKKKSDDQAAYTAAVSWVRHQISGGLPNTAADPELDQAYQLLASLLGADTKSNAPTKNDNLFTRIAGLFHGGPAAVGATIKTAAAGYRTSYQTPAKVLLDQARDQADNNTTAFLADIEAMKTAAEKAIKSGKLSIAATTQAYQVIASANSQLGQQATAATDFFAEAANEEATYGSNIAKRGGPLSGQDGRAILGAILETTHQSAQHLARIEKHTKSTSASQAAIVKRPARSMIDDARVAAQARY